MQIMTTKDKAESLKQPEREPSYVSWTWIITQELSRHRTGVEGQGGTRGLRWRPAGTRWETERASNAKLESPLISQNEGPVIPQGSDEGTEPGVA